MSTSIHPLPACPAALPARFLSLWPPWGSSPPFPLLSFGSPHMAYARPPAPPSQVSLFLSSWPQPCVYTLQRTPPKAFLNHRPAAGSCFLTTLGILVPSVWAFQAVGSPDLLPSIRPLPFPKHQLSPPWPQCPALLRTHLHGSTRLYTARKLPPEGTTWSLGAPVHTLPGRSSRFLPIPSVTLYSLQEDLRM